MSGYSREEIGKWKGRFLRLEAGVEKSVRKASTLALTQGGAFTGGLVRGYFADPTVMGVPADLLVGAGLLAFGLFSDDGYSEHALNFGNGLTASFSSALGAQLGAKLKAKTSSTSSGYTPQGMLSPGSGYTPVSSIQDMLQHAHG